MVQIVESPSTQKANQSSADVNPADERLTTLGARVPSGLKAKLVEEAGKRNMTQSQLVRKILEDNLNPGPESSEPDVDVNGIIRTFGKGVLENCEGVESGLCTRWDFDPSETEGIELVRHKDKHLARPTPELCGLCGVYRLRRTPIANLRDGNECSSCGAEDLVAVRYKCTNCGRESWWGVWPEEERGEKRETGG